MITQVSTECGDDSEKDIPVPMSNTEVKLLNAKSSWGIAPCEGRTLPCDYSGIAQLVEHLTVNQGVDGSSPPAGVSFKDVNRVVSILLCYKAKPMPA